MKDGVAPGLDKNGNYIWNEEGTFPFDEAMKLQQAEGYKENCGTIAVGISDDQIRKMLADPNIQMVIPYHKSSLNPIVAAMTNVDRFTNYEDYQNTKDAEGKALSAKNDFDWDNKLFELSHDKNGNMLPKSKWGNVQDLVQEYVDWCNKRGYTAKFEQFLYMEDGSINPGYYKLLEDFALLDNDGNFKPQGDVRVQFPTEADAFGSMADLIQQGLSEDTKLEAKRSSEISGIVDEIQKMIKKGTIAQNKKFSLRSKADEQLNQRYMDAINRGDMDTVTRMVRRKASENGFTDAIPEQTLAYKTRTGKAPTKTKTVYKIFTVDEQGRPSALFVSGVDALPQNVWLDAQDTWHFKNTKNGRFYVPSTKNPNTEGGKTGGVINRSDISDEDWAELVKQGFVKENSKSVTALAYRPGWHAGDLPFFPQGGTKIAGSNYENVHRFNQVVFECEVAYDVDYTKTHATKDGQVAFEDMQELPENGGYEFATNPMARAEDIGKWFISSSLKIKRALTEEECNKILRDNGRLPQEWQASEYKQGRAGQKLVGTKAIGNLNLEALGFRGTQFDAARKTLAPITYDDNGNIIPLSDRFDPEKNDVRYSLRANDKQNVGYHAGDLGKAESLFNQSSGRDTGHFGTGTYFVGNRANIEGYNSRNGQQAPVETVDFEKYNLFKPKSYRDADQLHSFMRYVDGRYGSYQGAKSTAEYDDLKEQLYDLYSEFYENGMQETQEDIDSYFFNDVEESERRSDDIIIDDVVRTADKTIGRSSLVDVIQKHSDADLSTDGDQLSLDEWETQITPNEFLKGLSHDDAENIIGWIETEASNWRNNGRDRASNYENWRGKFGDIANILGVSEDVLERTISEATEEASEIDYPASTTADSIATRVMKKLGYEGVDVRHIEGMDNTKYGSVIYDLKGEDLARKQEIGTARFSLRKLDSEYEEAYFDGDDERMQELVDEAARRAGYTYKAYHRTENAFTVFDINKARRGMDIQGFFFSADPNAEREYGSVRYDTYLKMDNPYIVDSYEKQKAIPFDMSQEDAGVTAREWLQENGYDGVIRKAEYFGGEADEYIVFDPSQIKSSDPVTNTDDENGEGDFIPLSERFNQQKKDIRYSLREDSTGKALSQAQAEYFKDSKILDANGNLLQVYHGSPIDNITVFDRNKAGSHTAVKDRVIWFTDDAKFAEDFSYEFKPTESWLRVQKGKKGKVYPGYLNITNPFDMTNPTQEMKDLLYKYGDKVLIDRLLEIGNHQLIKTIISDEGGFDAIEANYDGIIAKLDVKGTALEYGIFNSNQVKAIDNSNPTKNKDVRYSMKKTFAEQVDDVLEGTHNPRYDLYVMNTPGYLAGLELTNGLSFKNGPLLMRNSKVNELLKKHDEMSSNILKQLPDALQSPILVLLSKTHPNDSVVIICDVQTEKGDLVVPVWAEQEGSFVDIDLGEINDTFNFASGAYGRKVKSLIEYAAEHDEVLYMSDKEKVEQLLTRNELQLLTPLKVSDSLIKIAPGEENVNTEDRTFSLRNNPNASVQRNSLRGSGDIVAAAERGSVVQNAYMEYANKWRNNMSAFNEVGRSGFNANMSSLIRYYNGSLDKNATDRIVRDIRNLAREMIQDKNITYSDVVDKGNAIASKILWGKAGATDNMLLSEDAANAIDDIRNHMLVQILNSTTRGEGKYQRLAKEYSDYRKKANDRISEIRQKRDAKVENMKRQRAEERARRSDSADRTKLLNTMKRLDKISKHASEASKALIQEIIGDYNLVAKSITQGKADSLAELSKFIQDHMSADPDFMPTERTLKDLARLSQKNIADLSIEEVRMLNEALLNIEHEMRTNKRLIDSQYRQHISELGNEIIEGVRSTKGIGNGKIGVFNWFQQVYDSKLATPVIRPETEILRIIGFDRNNPLYQLTYGDTGSLASGQRDMVRYQWEANKRYADKFLNDKDFAETIMGKKARACEITGRRADGTTVKLKVTPDMLMALYMHAQNNHNFRHFGEWNDENGTQHGGGVTIPDFELYRKGKIQEAYRVGTRDGNLITMRKTDLNRAFQQLTEKEMSFVKSAQAYYSEMSQPEINRVSNLLLGYSIAQEENYFRINTDSNYRGTNMDAIKFDGTIEGMGFTKERIEGARNPILLIPLTEQFARDIDAHSKYIGLAIPVRNFNKAFGVNRQSYNENGDFTGTESSVQSAITGVWGSTATDYIQKLMSDIQNPKTSSEGWVKLFGKLRSFYAGSVLALNAGVAIKQAASYPTAAAEIGWMPLIKAFGNTRFQGKLDMDIINKYSPLMYLRTQGMGMQEIADLKNLNKGWLNKALNSKALNWIQDMDVMTVKKLWKAAEYYVRDNFKDLKVGSEEYYQKVGEVHSRVIERTQPNYTTLQRGEILRSDSDFIRMALGMFKTQPFQNASILFEATGELQAACRAYKVRPNSVTEAMRKAAVKKMARAVSSQIISSLVFAIMAAAWDWIRGRDDKYKDKEGKITFASAFKQIGINMGSNVFGMIPLGSVLYEVIETTVDTFVQNGGGEAVFNATAYGLDASTATGIVNDLVDAIGMLTKDTTSIDLDSKNTTEKHIRDYVSVLSSVAQAFGYPADNFVKDGQAIAVNVFRTLGATGQITKYEQEYYAKRVFTAVSKDKKGYLEILYKAYDNDKDAYNKLYSIYIENDGFATSKMSSKEYIDSKMEKYQKDQTKANNRESAGLTETQLNDYQEALNRFDADHNGQFTQEETYNALMSIALSQKQKETLWNERGWKKSLSEYKSKKK